MFSITLLDALPRKDSIQICRHFLALAVAITMARAAITMARAVTNVISKKSMGAMPKYASPYAFFLPAYYALARGNTKYVRVVAVPYDLHSLYKSKHLIFV